MCDIWNMNIVTIPARSHGTNIFMNQQYGKNSMILFSQMSRDFVKFMKILFHE